MSKVPQTPHFGSLNRHFKPNMRKIQIASDLCIRLTWNLTNSCGQQQRLCGWSRMVVKQFQDGGRQPFWKSIYRHISVKNNRIFMKFCTQQHILTGWTSRDQKWKVAEEGKNPVAGLWRRTLGESWPPSFHVSIDFWCQLVANPGTAASWMSVVAMVRWGYLLNVY